MPTTTKTPTTTDERIRHRKLMRLCLEHGTTEAAWKAVRNKRPLPFLKREIEQASDELTEAQVTKTCRLLTVNQAAVALGVIPRRVRLLCQDGRLGTQVGGGPWVIERTELIDFLDRQHKSGQAGREAAEEDKMATEDRHGVREFDDSGVEV